MSNVLDLVEIFCLFIALTLIAIFYETKNRISDGAFFSSIRGSETTKGTHKGN